MFTRFRAIARLLLRPDGLRWTCADQTRALARGWGLFEHDEETKRVLQLQAADDRADHHAWLQVTRDADAGDSLSKKALCVLAYQNYEEFEAIRNYAARRGVRL